MALKKLSDDTQLKEFQQEVAILKVIQFIRLSLPSYPRLTFLLISSKYYPSPEITTSPCNSILGDL